MVLRKLSKSRNADKGPVELINARGDATSGYYLHGFDLAIIIKESGA